MAQSKAATATAKDGDDQPLTIRAVTAAADDDDELFELDISLLNRHDADGDLLHQHYRAAVPDDDGDGRHALLANCLLPVSSVSSAVPVSASSIFVSSYPYSGYYTGSRRLLTGGGGSRSFLRRSGGSSARFCFSSRGFEAMGNFQR